MKRRTEFLEAWDSGQSTINKHIYINPVYQTIRKIPKSHKIKNQVREDNQNEYTDNDMERVYENQSMSTEQAVNHMWKNLNNSLLFHVCADSTIQWDSASFTIKLSISGNETLS